MTHVRNQIHHYVFLFILLAGIIFVRGGAERNLWSLRYIWQQMPVSAMNNGDPLLERFPNLRLWQAQDAFRAGDLTRAAEAIEPLVASNFFPTPFSRNYTLRLYGALLESAGNREKAFAIWRDIQDVNSLQGAAKKAVDEGDLSTARLAYELAAELDPQAGAQPLANFLWRNLEEPGDAEAILRQALTDYPYSGERQRWLHQLGQIYLSQKQLDDAIAIYEYLLQLEPNDAVAALRIADAKMARGDGVATVMAQYQLAISLDPNRGDGYFAIGQLLAQSGEYGMADQWFEQAVSHNPQAYGYQQSYAANAKDLNDIDLAVTRYRRLVTNFPENHKASAEAAWVYYLTGESSEAKEAIDTALRLAGPAAPALYKERAEKIYGE